MKNILVSICARGGSKGIPGKNIRPINGKPLIGYSLESAQKFALKYNAVVALSTDSLEIRETVAKMGLVTDYLRPAELATDTAGKVPVLHHLYNYESEKRNITFDYLLDLDVSSPLRNLEDLEKAYAVIENDEEALNLISVSAAHKNPYFNMMEQMENGYYGVSKKLPGAILSRQSAPKVYDINGSFYFYRKKFFDLGLISAVTDKTLIYTVPHICFDLDEPIDFAFMQFVLENNRLDFEL